MVLIAVAVILVRDLFGVNTHGARVIHFTMNSPLVHQTLTGAAVIPSGGSAGRPLLVFLVSVQWVGSGE
jgi:hypothetical protein